MRRPKRENLALDFDRSQGIFALTSDALSLFYGLLMVETFRHDRGFVVSGANNAGAIGIRQITDLSPHLRPTGARVNAVTVARLERAAVVASGIHTIYSAAEPSERLRQGFRAWLSGVREEFGSDRLHQFVRAIEAVVKPMIGRSERQFVHTTPKTDFALISQIVRPSRFISDSTFHASIKTAFSSTSAGYRVVTSQALWITASELWSNAGSNTSFSKTPCR